MDMAGRGRGRGRGGKGMSFSVESLGFGRGESLPGPILQPPPIFPVSENTKPKTNGGEFSNQRVSMCRWQAKPMSRCWSVARVMGVCVCVGGGV